MKKTKIIGILIVILSLAVSLFITNRDYIFIKLKKEDEYINYDVDSMKLLNIPAVKTNLPSEEKSQVFIKLNHEDAKEIVIDGNMTDYKNQEIKVYYKHIGGTVFEESQMITPEIHIKNEKYILNLNLKLISELRIDFEVFDEKLDISNVRIRAYYPQVGWLSLLFTLILSLIFAILIQIPISKYKNIPNQLRIFLKYRFLLTNLVKKDITLKYRRSVLGIFWSVLNPLLMMLVMTAVFQKLFKSDIENFPIYYLTGSLIFNFVSEATNGSMMSMIEASSLLKKVYIPKYLFPMEKTLFALINMIFSLIAVIIIYIVLSMAPPITVLLFPIPILYTMIFSLGFGMILATLNVFFRDVTHLYGVFTTVWMYLTPIMYPIDILPSFVRNIVKINPLYHYVNYFRNIMYLGVVPSFRENLICLFFSVTFLLFGTLVFKRFQDRFILYI